MSIQRNITFVQFIFQTKEFPVYDLCLHLIAFIISKSYLVPIQMMSQIQSYYKKTECMMFSVKYYVYLYPRSKSAILG